MNKRLLWFFIVVFSAAWCIWIGSRLLYVAGMIGLPVYAVTFRAGTFVPSLIGILFAGLTERRNGIAALFRSTVRARFQGKWYLLIFSAAPAALLTTLWLLSIIRREPLGITPLWVMPAVFAHILLLGGPLAEELGWRGYTLPHLLSRYTPFLSSVMLGGIWSVWHLPLFFIQGTVQHLLLGHGAAAPAGYLLYTLCVSVLVTIAYLGGKNSVFAAILMHTMCNFALGISKLITFQGGIEIYLACFVGVTCAIAYANRRLLLTPSPVPASPGTPETKA